MLEVFDQLTFVIQFYWITLNVVFFKAVRGFEKNTFSHIGLIGKLAIFSSYKKKDTYVFTAG